MNSITLKENRAELVETMEAILDSAKSEDRDLSADESKSWEGFDTEIKALDKKIAIAERQEQLNKSIAVNMSVQNSEDIAKKEMKSWSLFKAVRDIQNGGLTGVEKEMHQEAENEKRGTLNGIGLPSFMTNKAEQRAFVDQGASGIAPVAINAFADALIEDSLWNRVGLTNLGTLAADTVVPITGANAVEWAAENAAGTDTSTDFSKITLSTSLHFACTDPEMLPVLEKYIWVRRHGYLEVTKRTELAKDQLTESQVIDVESVLKTRRLKKEVGRTSRLRHLGNL